MDQHSFQVRKRQPTSPHPPVAGDSAMAAESSSSGRNSTSSDAGPNPANSPVALPSSSSETPAAQASVAGATRRRSSSPVRVTAFFSEEVSAEQKTLRNLAGGFIEAGREHVKQLSHWALLGMASHGFSTDEVSRGPNKKPLTNVLYLYTPQQRADYLTEFINGKLNYIKKNSVDAKTVPVHAEPVEIKQVTKERSILYMELYHAKLISLLKTVGTPDAVDTAGKIAAFSTEDLFKHNLSLVNDAKALIGKTANVKSQREAKAEIVKEEQGWEAGRLIFVMDGDGRFYVGNSVNGSFHHSSFLAGEGVAAAGDIVVNQGEIKMISNTSGHYKPGAAFLWQAVHQLNLQGANMNTIMVEVHGAGRINAKVFLENFSPLADPSSSNYLSFDGKEVKALKAFIEKQERGKK